MISNILANIGKPKVEVNGITYYRSHRIEQQGKFRIIIRVIEVNSKYRQGIAFCFSTNPKFKGAFFLNGQKFVSERQKQNYVIPIIWPETNEFVIDFDVQDGYFILANASDFLDDYPDLLERISRQTGRTREQFRNNSYASGLTASNLYGNAFWIEKVSSNLFRFHCNDHEMDDDFNDLIFDLEVQDKDQSGDG